VKSAMVCVSSRSHEEDLAILFGDIDMLRSLHQIMESYVGLSFSDMVTEINV